MKAEAPAALLSQTSQGTRKAGAKKTALAAPSAKKGLTPFWRLMSAKAGTAETAEAAAAKVAAAGAEALKMNLTLALAAAATKKGTAKPPTAAKVEIASEKEKAPKETKAAARKAAGQHAASLADVARGDQALAQAVKTKTEAAPKQEAGDPAAADARTVSAGARAGGAKAFEPVIRVVDLRSRKDAAGAESVSATHGAKTAVPAESTEKAGTSFAQRLSTQPDAGPELPQRAEPAAAAPAQTPLERLQEMAGSELTRATSLILKDGGGEIRLMLKPDSLGSVRIRMQIEDNAIQGTIIVDNSAVKHIVDGSIDALRRAFTAEGFQTASLQVSVGGQNADGSARRDRDDAQPAAVRRVESAQGFSQNIPGVEYASMGDLLVNLFV